MMHILNINQYVFVSLGDDLSLLSYRLLVFSLNTKKQSYVIPEHHYLMVWEWDSTTTTVLQNRLLHF